MSLVEFKSWWGYWSGSDKLPENTDIRYAFEAGQQSQQGEVNKLQTKIDLLEKELTETQAFLNKQNHIKQVKINELQARVDEITNHVGINFDEERDDDQHSYWSGYNQAMRELNDILKVESK